MAPSRPIEVVAAEWLGSERQLIALHTPVLEEAARLLADEYEEAIRHATQDEMRFALASARASEADCEVGSTAWAQARSVAELIRVEIAARTGQP